MLDAGCCVQCTLLVWICEYYPKCEAHKLEFTKLVMRSWATKLFHDFVFLPVITTSIITGNAHCTLHMHNALWTKPRKNGTSQTLALSFSVLL